MAFARKWAPKRRIIIVFLLSILVSVVWSFWSIFADILASLNSSGIFTCITIAYLVTVLGSIPLALKFKNKTDTKISKRPKIKFIYPLLGGAVMGLGIVLFYGLVGNKDFPFVSSMMFSGIMVMAFLISRLAKTRPNKFYIIGTAVVIAGLALQTLALYGFELASSLYIIILSVVMMLAYSAGDYLVFYSAYQGVAPSLLTPLNDLGILCVAFIGGLLFGGFSIISHLTMIEIVLSVAVGLLVIMGDYFSFYAIRMIKGEKSKIINIANILQTLEVVGVALFSIFYLSLSLPLIILGFAVLFIGLALIAIS